MTGELAKGLDGVLVAESELSHVDGEAGELIYRGYSIESLAEHASYEEVVYLLWNGSLPTEAELEQFRARLADARALDQGVIDLLSTLADAGESPMSALRTATSMLSAYDASDPYASGDPADGQRTGADIVAKVTTIIAAYDRLRRDEAIVEPDTSLSLAADFLRMRSAEAPSELAAETFDMSLILHADHGLNASTFGAMVIGATMADLYCAVTGGIGALSGPLHGGANQDVMRMFRDIEDSDLGPVEWVQEMMDRGDRIPGFGHRVYRVKDPRAVILDAKATALAEESGQGTYINYARAIENFLTEEGLVDKGIAPNVDFFSGALYDQLDIPLDLYTPIFALSRTAGWIGHVLEYQADNRIIRPRARYVGPTDQEFVPLEER